ncbi:hypothetical protein Hanom_Chr16g01449841 [Helianthus anomalus]
MGNSFGCSASGERLVSAARDGDFYCGQVIILRFRNRHGHPILAPKICSPKFRAILCSSSINPKVRLIA